MSSSNLSETTSTPDPCAGTIDAPTTELMVEFMSVADFVLLPICTIFAFAILVMFITEVLFLNKHFTSCERRRRKTLVILGLHPVFALTSLTVIWVPRSVVTVELVSQTYLSYSIYTFLHLVPDYYGGRDMMIQKLDGCKIRRHPQTLCCSKWLPPVLFSEQAFRIIKYLILQFAVLRPLLTYIIAVIWANGSAQPGSFDPHNITFYLRITIFTSVVINAAGMLTFMGVAESNLPDFHLKPKYLSVQLVLLTTFLFGVIIDAIASRGIIPCHPPFSSKARASRITHIIYIMEMVPLCILARFAYLRSYEYETKADEERPRTELRDLAQMRQSSQATLVNNDDVDFSYTGDSLNTTSSS